MLHEMVAVETSIDEGNITRAISYGSSTIAFEEYPLEGILFIMPRKS